MPKHLNTPGLPQLLPYAALIDDGIVLTKTGALMAGWYYRGPDVESSTRPELISLRARINHVLARLGDGWMINVDAIRVPSTAYPEGGAFTGLASQLIDAERRQQFEAEGVHFETRYALIMSWLPPKAYESSLIDVLFTEDDQPVDRSRVKELLFGWLGPIASLFGSSEPAKRRGRDLTGQRLDYFKRQVRDFGEALAYLLQMQRMGTRITEDSHGFPLHRDQLVEYLAYALTGHYQPVNVPPCPMYLDAWLPSGNLYTGVAPRLDDQNIQVICIDGVPGETYPAMLAALEGLSLPFRYATRFIYLDRQESLRYIEACRKKWRQKERGFWDQFWQSNRGPTNLDAMSMTADAEAAGGEAESGMVAFGFWTATVVLQHEDADEAIERARLIEKTLENMGFAARIEDLNAVEAWLGSLPGEGVANVRRPILHTLNLSDLLPTTSVWTGAEYNPSRAFPPNSPPLLHSITGGATPYRMNLHVSDVGHTLVLGPTGAGKSTLLSLIASQFQRYEGAQVFVLDKGKSIFALACADGASWYDIGEGEDIAFAPLSHLESHTDMAWARQWVEDLLTLQGVIVTPAHRNVIRTALELRRSEAREYRSLSDFVSDVQDVELREALDDFTINNPAYGRLLDAKTDKMRQSSFLALELGTLMDMGDRIVLPVLQYLFRIIERRLDGRPSLLIVDEAWLMLKHPVFAGKIQEWLKTMRKRNCAVVLATQEVADVANSPIRDVIMASTPTKILLPNAEARNPAGREFYEQIGLNERQIEIIADGTAKRDYYVLSPVGRRSTSLSIGPVALAFCGAGNPADHTRIRQLMAQYGPDGWVPYWLRERGLDAWAEFATNVQHTHAA